MASRVLCSDGELLFVVCWEAIVDVGLVVLRLLDIWSSLMYQLTWHDLFLCVSME